MTVEITDDEFIVDLRDNPDQDPGPNNASRDGAVIAAQINFMNLTGRPGLRERGPLSAADGAHALRLGVRPEATGCVRDVLRAQDPVVRPDLALPGAAPG